MTAAPTQRTDALRPELADAAFDLWLLDRSDEWRGIARDHFLAMRRWNRAAYGFADPADVTSEPERQAGHCPGYWWSEQMKHCWLIFSGTRRFDYRRNYLSTEGNVLLEFRPADRLDWKAGQASTWSRYAPYPCASISSLGTKRSEALLMQ